MNVTIITQRFLSKTEQLPPPPPPARDTHLDWRLVVMGLIKEKSVADSGNKRSHPRLSKWPDWKSTKAIHEAAFLVRYIGNQSLCRQIEVTVNKTQKHRSAQMYGPNSCHMFLIYNMVQKEKMTDSKNFYFLEKLIINFQCTVLVFLWFKKESCSCILELAEVAGWLRNTHLYWPLLQ